MPTPAQSRAAAAHKAKRQEAGEKVVSVWLSARAQTRLAYLTVRYGTQQKALEAVLLTPAGEMPPDPSKPVSAKPKAPAAPPKVYGHPKPTKGKR
jgi:hypothetical protein